MESFFPISALVVIVLIGGKLAKDYFKWISKEFKNKK